MHLTTAVAMGVLIGSGWGTIDDCVVARGVYFPKTIRLGSLVTENLLWHSAATSLLVANGGAYLIYGVMTGRLRERLLLILYIVAILAGVGQVDGGVAIWNPVQLSGLVALLGGFHGACLVHTDGLYTLASGVDLRAWSSFRNEDRPPLLLGAGGSGGGSPAGLGIRTDVSGAWSGMGAGNGSARLARAESPSSVLILQEVS